MVNCEIKIQFSAQKGHFDAPDFFNRGLFHAIQYLAFTLKSEQCRSITGFLPLHEELSNHCEKEAGGQAAHQDAGQTLNRSEQPPAFGQNQVAVTQSRVSDARK